MKRWAQPREICAPCWDSVAGEGQRCWNLLNSPWNPPLLIRVSTLCLVTRALVQNLKSRTMKQTRSTHSFTVCLSFSQSIRNSAVSVSHWQSHKNCNWYCQRDQASPIRRPYHPVSTASQSRTVNKWNDQKPASVNGNLLPSVPSAQLTSSVRPSTPFSADTDTPIFCCQSNTIPIFWYASRADVAPRDWQIKGFRRHRRN